VTVSRVSFVLVMRWLVIAAVATLALVLIRNALAGGSFDRIVGVGANGASVSVKLDQSGPGSEASLQGPAVAVPRGGYVRLYPFIGGLPAIPGRYYPAIRVICLYWHEPASNCSRIGVDGARLLAPVAKLPLRHNQPTAPVAVRYRSQLLRYADGNIFAAIELALERQSISRSSPPADAIPLNVSWRGPNVRQRPRTLFLTPRGVYVSHRRFALSRGPWCYLAVNLPEASASLIEATSRICR
jgi:hypothetical protein